MDYHRFPFLAATILACNDAHQNMRSPTVQDITSDKDLMKAVEVRFPTHDLAELLDDLTHLVDQEFPQWLATDARKSKFPEHVDMALTAYVVLHLGLPTGNAVSNATDEEGNPCSDFDHNECGVLYDDVIENAVLMLRKALGLKIVKG